MFESELAPNEFVWSWVGSVVFFKILSSCGLLVSFCSTQKEQEKDKAKVFKRTSIDYLLST